MASLLASDEDRNQTSAMNVEEEESTTAGIATEKKDVLQSIGTAALREGLEEEELKRQSTSPVHAESSANADQPKVHSSAQSGELKDAFSVEMETANITSCQQQETMPAEEMVVSKVISEGHAIAELSPKIIQGQIGLSSESDATSIEQTQKGSLKEPINTTSKENPGQPTIQPNSANEYCQATTDKLSVGTINKSVEQEPANIETKEQSSSKISSECEVKDVQMDTVVQGNQTVEPQRETKQLTQSEHTAGVSVHGNVETVQVQKLEKVEIVGDFSLGTEDQLGMKKEPASDTDAVAKPADPVDTLEEGTMKIESDEKKPTDFAADPVSQGEHKILTTDATSSEVIGDGGEKTKIGAESENISTEKDRDKETLTEEQQESRMIVTWESKRVDLLDKAPEETGKSQEEQECTKESNVPTSLHQVVKEQPSSNENPEETTSSRGTPHQEICSKEHSEKQASMSTLEEASPKTEEPMEVDGSNERLRISQGSPMDDSSKDLPPQNFKPFSSYTLEGRLKESAVKEPTAAAQPCLPAGEVLGQSLGSTSQDASAKQRESENSPECQDSAKFSGVFLNFLKCSDNATEHSIPKSSETLQSADSRDLVENGEEKSGMNSADCNAQEASKDNADTTNSASCSNQERLAKQEVLDESSNLSSQSERKTRRRRGKKEIEKKVEDGTETVTEEKSETKAVDSGFAAETLFEYQWPQDKTGEWFFLQEHLSAYLGIISFKRKYPDLQRRPVVMDERNFLMESGVVSEMQCDLGLTALKSDEVYEFMLKDFPEKYQAYAEVLHAREKQRLSDKNKAYGEMVKHYSPQAKMDKNKIEDLVKKAVRNAAEFNAQFMRERREERGAYFDLQTHELHYPLSTIKKLPPEATKISSYPVALIPGQFQDYHKSYTPQQLKYFPLMTATYDPPRRLKTIFADPADKYESELESQSASSDEAEDGSGSSSGSSSGSNSDDDSSSSSSSEDEVDVPTPAPSTSSSTKKSVRTPRGKKFVMPLAEMTCREAAAMCNICQGSADKNKIGEAEELVKCSECGRHGHPSCLELTEEMIPMIKIYPWQCMECKTCVECMDPYDEDKMMFCDHCDRGYHTFCVGLRSIPTGRWECPSCRPEIPAKKRKK